MRLCNRNKNTENTTTNYKNHKNLSINLSLYSTSNQEPQNIESKIKYPNTSYLNRIQGSIGKDNYKVLNTSPNIQPKENNLNKDENQIIEQNPIMYRDKLNQKNTQYKKLSKKNNDIFDNLNRKFKRFNNFKKFPTKLKLANKYDDKYYTKQNNYKYDNFNDYNTYKKIASKKNILPVHLFTEGNNNDYTNPELSLYNNNKYDSNNKKFSPENNKSYDIKEREYKNNSKQHNKSKSTYDDKNRYFIPKNEINEIEKEKQKTYPIYKENLTNQINKDLYQINESELKIISKKNQKLNENKSVPKKNQFNDLYQMNENEIKIINKKNQKTNENEKIPELRNQFNNLYLMNENELKIVDKKKRKKNRNESASNINQFNNLFLMNENELKIIDKKKRKKKGKENNNENVEVKIKTDKNWLLSKKFDEGKEVDINVEKIGIDEINKKLEEYNFEIEGKKSYFISEEELKKLKEKNINNEIDNLKQENMLLNNKIQEIYNYYMQIYQQNILLVEENQKIKNELGNLNNK